jgi:ribonuclease HI
MARISVDQIGLRDAADLFGVSIDTLRRRIRDNQLEEAQLVQGPFGATWVLPRESLDVIAEREHWELDGVSRDASHGQGPATNRVRTAHREPTDPDAQPEAVIDLTRTADQVPIADQVPNSGTGVGPTAGSGAAVAELTASVASEVAKGLADNVQMELTAVREAITAAEVKAVAAEARTDALRSEKGRLEAQLKRAQADIEYWRSQHDRIDRDLDRERGLRTSAEKAKAVSEAETREVRQRLAELSVELHDTQGRERALIGAEASLQAELDQATMAMGWWSRRRLERLRARSAMRTPPSSAGE